MRVLLLGSTGLAGSAFKSELLARHCEVISVSRSGADINFDLTDFDKLSDILNSVKHDAIINVAANINITDCEIWPNQTSLINSDMVKVLANLSKKTETPLLQVSTDHYYSEGGNRAHKETDSVTLLNEYAKQKFAAERHALSSPYSIVLRTSIVGYNEIRKNSLIMWAIRNLIEGKEINLYQDAYTSAVCVKLFARYASDILLSNKTFGLFNLASCEVFSKEKLIRSLATSLNLSHDHCRSVKIQEIDKKRANCLGLDVSKIEKILGRRMPSLKETIVSIRNDFNRHELQHE